MTTDSEMPECPIESNEIAISNEKEYKIPEKCPSPPDEKKAE